MNMEVPAWQILLGESVDHLNMTPKPLPFPPSHCPPEMPLITRVAVLYDMYSLRGHVVLLRFFDNKRDVTNF